MSDFDALLASWQTFYLAQLGAGAALLGLLFVALSLNLDRILAYPSLPLRAEIALMLLALQIVICSVMLMPDQGAVATGVEILVLASCVWAVATLMSLRIERLPDRNEHPRGWGNVVFLQAATLSYMLGAVMILQGAPAGPRVLALGVVLSFLKAILDAWVLLVEIKR